MNWWVINRRQHSSWMIVETILLFVIGVWFSKFYTSLNNYFLLFSIFMVIIGLRKSKLKFLPLIIIGGFYLGLYRGSLEQINISGYSDYFSKTVEIYGRVSGDIRNDYNNQISFDLKIIKFNNKSSHGKIRASINKIDIKSSDELIISGKLSKYRNGYVGKIIDAKIIKNYKYQNNQIDKIKDGFSKNIKSEFNQTESALALGFLIGEKDDLPTDFSLALQAAGLTHIVVASGYNLTILVRLAKRLFEKVSKYLVAFSGFLLIFGFLMITGASPSMFRASIVASLSLLAWYYGRNFHPLVLIIIAMGVTVLVNPQYIWGDLSWQLSFAAFIGVLVLAPLIRHYLFKEGKANFVFQILIETFSAQVLTAPLIIASFGQFSNVSIFSNLLILPLVPLAMLLTFISGSIGVIIPLLIYPAKILLGYMVNAINFFGNLSWSISTVSLNEFGVFVFYFIICLICVYLWRVTKYNLRDVNIVE